MRKFIATILIACVPYAAMAECDFRTGVSRNDNGTYTYTKECHVKVGEMKQDLEIVQEQNSKLTKALELKDLALAKSDERADMWQHTTFKLEDRINTIDSMRSTNQWIMFGLGMATMFGATYAASKLSNR